MKILVVDDDKDMVTSLVRILETYGFEADFAYDGETAAAKNLSWEPDAVIMDICMPQINGIDTAWEILKERPEVSVILMTGFSDVLAMACDGVLSESCRNGQVKLTMKPLNMEYLVSLLHENSEEAASVARGQETT